MTKNNIVKYNNYDLIHRNKKSRYCKSNKHTPSNSILKLKTVNSRINKFFNNLNFQKEKNNSCDIKPKKKFY